MGEQRVIDQRPGPYGPNSIRDDLRALGVRAGSVLLVHSSLSRLGWVAGGAHSVVLALLEAVGTGGTLVMPTHSGHLSDPSGWGHPPVPESWWPAVRQHTPAFDPNLTPTRQMGAIVECFRHVPDVVRSSHPSVSFAAVGPRAEEIAGTHELVNGLGEGSPLARLYDADAWILLLGVGHQNNTSLHLGEYRADFPGKKWMTQGAPVLVEGQRRWLEYPDLDLDDSDFERLGADFAATGMEKEARVGGGSGKLIRQRAVVDFAVGWFAGSRQRPPLADGPASATG